MMDFPGEEVTRIVRRLDFYLGETSRALLYVLRRHWRLLVLLRDGAIPFGRA